MSKCSKSTKCCYVTSSLLLLWTLNIISDQAGNTSVQTGWYPISISRDRYTQRLSGAGEELMRCSAENSATALFLFGRLLFPHQSWCNVCSNFIIVTVYSSEDDYSESGGFQAQTITGPWRGAQQPITGWTDAQNDRKFQVLLTNEQT